MYLIHVISILWLLFSITKGRGLLLLYRPKDVSNDCAFSQHLRYDISFGMGMSDTITLVSMYFSDTTVSYMYLVDGHQVLHFSSF